MIDHLLMQEPKLAFEDVDAAELYPCVMFYSSNPGEKVRSKPVNKQMDILRLISLRSFLKIFF